MRSVASVPSVCAACRAPHPLEVGEEVRGGQLRWFERFACPCGHGFEAGAVGLPSPAVRNALLAQAGRAQVWVDEPAAAAKAEALLVKGLAVPAEEAARRLATLPAVAWEGTPPEAAFLAAALARAGVAARVVNHLPAR